MRQRLNAKTNYILLVTITFDKGKKILMRLMRVVVNNRLFHADCHHTCTRHRLLIRFSQSLELLNPFSCQ